MASGKITKRSVDSLIANAAEGFLWDSSLTGFGAKYSKSGAVAYILQFRWAVAKRRPDALIFNVDGKAIMGCGCYA